GARPRRGPGVAPPQGRRRRSRRRHRRRSRPRRRLAMTDRHAPRTGADNDRWYHPFAPRGGARAVELTPDLRDWAHTPLRVATLADGASLTHRSAGEELVVVPLVGGAVVTVDGTDHELAGRGSVFAGPTDSLYVPAGRELTLRAKGAARIAVCGARVQ